VLFAKAAVFAFAAIVWVHSGSGNAAPVIGVSGSALQLFPDTVSTDDLDNTDMGDIYIAGKGISKTAPFLIYNLGDQNLLLDNTTPVTFSGPNAGEFTPVTAGDISVVPPGAQVGFSVRCTPESSGQKNATLTIHSNDPVHPTFSFALHANAINAPQPALQDYSLAGAQVAVKRSGKLGAFKWKIKGSVLLFAEDSVSTSPASYQVYLSSDPFRDPGDQPIISKASKSKVTNKKPKKLAVKYSSTVDTEGKYLIITVDGLHERAELNETNNSLVIPVPPAAL
jgi:hypothetical protein